MTLRYGKYNKCHVNGSNSDVQKTKVSRPTSKYAPTLQHKNFK